MILERTVPIVVSEPREPRSMVSYGGREYGNSRYPDLPLTPRYDERWVDEREFRPRRDYAPREREAEDYMDRPFERRTIERDYATLEREADEYIDRPFERTTEPRIIYRIPNPFAPSLLPRRYPSSNDDNP